MLLIKRLIFLATCLLFTTAQVIAAPLNQLKMIPIYKDSSHYVYFSPDWVSKIKKHDYEVTVLFDFNSKDNHSGFEGNIPYMSSETRYVIDCKSKSIAFGGDQTYEEHMAGGKELDNHERRISTIEFLPMSLLDQTSDLSVMDIDKSYKEIINNTCKRTTIKR
jgi:hypothetical protein